MNKKEGNIWAGYNQKIVIDYDDFDKLAALGPSAFALYSHLRRLHWDKDFAIPNDMRLTMPGRKWSLKRFQDARKALITDGWIEIVRKAPSTVGPALSRWSD